MEYNSERVYEIVPVRDADEMHGCLAEDCRFNKQGAWLNLDADEFVEESEIIQVEIPRHQQIIFPGTMRNSFTSELNECRTQRRTSKDECGIVRGKHNVVLLHNPNQGVITTVQEDNNYSRTEITRHTTQA